MGQEIAYEPFKDPETLYATNPALVGELGSQGVNLIMGFTGFSDAGQVVRQVSQELLTGLSAEPVAVFDVDQLIDYRSRRPQVSFVEDHLQDYQQPQLALYQLTDGLGKPFLLLTGNEPDLQWERFSSAVVRLVERLNVNSISWVHAIPMPVPHTRPTGVTVHGNRPELIEGVSSWKTSVQFPSGVGHLLEIRLIEAGFKVAGYAVHVPHYLAEAEYPSAAVAGLEYLGAAASLMLPTDRLREAGREVEQSIAEHVNASAEVQGVVQRLEEQYDQYHQERPIRSLLAGHLEENTDNLVADIEAYLADQPPADPSTEG